MFVLIVFIDFWSATIITNSAALCKLVSKVFKISQNNKSCTSFITKVQDSQENEFYIHCSISISRNYKILTLPQTDMTAFSMVFKRNFEFYKLQVRDFQGSFFLHILQISLTHNYHHHSLEGCRRFYTYQLLF